MTDQPTFSSLNLDERLLTNLDRLGFDKPTGIQAEAIPPLLAGRDVIGRARTGSGKTAAYGLPLLQRVDEATGQVRALILAPTRELALQVTDALRDLAKKLPVQVVTIYGGAPYGPQLRALSRGVPIVVGTPGRVLDHMDKGSLDLSGVEFLVLDEADEMLRMGFIDDVETIVGACPPERQVALLSATMPDDIRKIAKGHLKDPVELSLEDDGPRVDHIDQYWIKVPQRKKLAALQRLLATSPPGATLVFARTRKGCAEVADALTRDGVAADALHGDLSQAARERVVSRLRAGGLGVVIATDVAARGIDVEHIGRVINLDLPHDAETYVHRIGRTARAGRDGEAISFVTGRERRRLIRFAKGLGVRIEPMDVPSLADIAQHQQNVLGDQLATLRDDADLEAARRFLDELLEDDWSLEDVAAAAVARLAELTGVELDPEAAKAPPEPERPAPPQGRPPSDEGMVEVFIAAGKRHGLRPGDVVGALANEVGLPSAAIGRIDIHFNKSFVGLPPDMADHLLKNFPTLELRGRHARLDRARGPGPHGGPGGGGGGRGGHGGGGRPRRRGDDRGRGGGRAPRRGGHGGGSHRH